MQSFDDYEIIVTDDSPDDSVENLIKEFLPCAKLKYQKNMLRKGSPENWNQAIMLSSGEYIKILHHDDWFSGEDSLLEFVRMLDVNPHINFAFCSSLAYGENQQFKFLHEPSTNQINSLRNNPNYLYPDNFIGSPSATIFRSKAKKLFDPKLKWVVDIDFYINILNDCSEFVYYPKPLVCITSGAASQVTNLCSGNKDVELFEWVYLYKKLRKKRIPDYRHIRFLWNLLKNYKVKSAREITDLGIEPPVPGLIRAMIISGKLV
jgi:glycosyltransferase involved in cell wall biosynthesis